MTTHQEAFKRGDLEVIRFAGWVVGVPMIAAYSGRGVTVVRQAIKSGALTAYRLDGGGTFTCKRADVDAWITAHGPVVPSTNTNQ